MVRAAGLAALVTLLGACSDDPAPLEPAALAEVCGAPGAFQLLSLAPDERVGSDPENFTVVGDRLLFIAGKGQRYLSTATGPLPATTTVYSVGPCGESPVVVAHDIDRIYEDPLWPGVALGCPLGSLDLLRLDPSGAAEPVLLATHGCYARVTAHGLLTKVVSDDLKSTANFYPILDLAGLVLGAPIQVADPVPGYNSSPGAVQLLPHEVLLREPSGDLVSFALPDLKKTLVQPGVAIFAASDDARYLLYQQLSNSSGAEGNRFGTIQISDRSSGASVPVSTGFVSDGPYHFRFPGFATVQPYAGERLISLPDLAFFDVPTGHALMAQLADGHWLTRMGPFGPWYILDLETAQATLVSDSLGQLQGHSEAHFDLLLSKHLDPQHDRPMMRFFFDGREPQTLAMRANLDAIAREEGRILTMVDVDARWIGELTLVDPSTQEARHIDDHVVAAKDLDRWVHPTEPDTIIYSVVDGERTGVWLALPAPLGTP